MQLLSQHNVTGLRRFAWQMALAVIVLFAGILPWLFSWPWPHWPFYLAAGLVLLALVYPQGVYYPYRAWMAFTAIMGWINTRLVLGIVFYVLIFPIGLVLRVTGKLQYRAAPTAPSYWQKPDKQPTAKDLEDPF